MFRRFRRKKPFVFHTKHIFLKERVPGTPTHVFGANIRRIYITKFDTLKVFTRQRRNYAGNFFRTKSKYLRRL